VNGPHLLRSVAGQGKNRLNLACHIVFSVLSTRLLVEGRGPISPPRVASITSLTVLSDMKRSSIPHVGEAVEEDDAVHELVGILLSSIVPCASSWPGPGIPIPAAGSGSSTDYGGQPHGAVLVEVFDDLASPLHGGSRKIHASAWGGGGEVGWGGGVWGWWGVGGGGGALEWGVVMVSEAQAASDQETAKHR